MLAGRPEAHVNAPQSLTSRKTLEEIARRARVSTSTVSRVLNGETKGAYPKIASRNERILAIADQLNYRPSFRGRIFQGGKTLQVALLYSHSHPMIDGVYGEMIASAVETLRSHDYHLTLWGLAGNEETDMFLDRRFDGFLVHHTLTDDVRTAIQRADRPIGLINAEAPGYDHVRPDDEAGAQILTRHLLDLGHRRILYVRLPIDHTSAERRLAGFRAAMQQAGLEAPELVADYDDIGVTWDRIRAASSGGEAPTAVLFYTDVLAADSMGLWREAGIDVPSQVSIAAFNNSPASHYAYPGITVMDIPFREMGRVAAERLFDRITSGGVDADTIEPQVTILPETLITRSSTARPTFGRGNVSA